jgi:hypothetical protein
LYKSNENLQKKEEIIKRQFNIFCPFKPKLTKETKSLLLKIKKPEKQEEFIERLANSKKNKSLLQNISRLNTINHTGTSISKSKVHLKSETSNNRSHYLITSTLDSNSKNVRVDTNSSSHNRVPLSHNYHSEKRRIRDVQQEKALKNEINNLKLTQVKAKNIFREKFSRNIDKFKLNNIKDLYETICNNCSEASDLDNLEQFGISTHIKERLIIPTFKIITNRNLEFNFHNFYTISNEILNKFF